MKKFYDLKDLNSCIDDFRYVYSPLSKTFNKFRQDDGYVSNYRNDEDIKNSALDSDVPDYFYGVNPDEFVWIGLLSKKKYGPGTKVTLHSFYTPFSPRFMLFL